MIWNFIFVSLILLIEIIFTVYIITVIKKNKTIITNDNFIYLGVSYGLLYVLYIITLLNTRSLDIFDLFANINSTLDAFTFKFDLDLIRSLTTQNIYFMLVFIYTISLTSLSTVLTVASLFKHRIINTIKLKKAFKNKSDIVLGDSPSAREYIKNNDNAIIWDDKSDYKELVKEDIGICNEKLTSKNLAAKINNKEHHLILFRDSSYSYSDILTLYEEAIEIRKKKKYNLNENNALFLHIEAFIEEQPTINEHFIKNVSKESNSYVTCFNKYELYARKFIMEHPISKYIPRDFYDEKNFSLKENKKINVVFLGFGKVNLELFKLMAMEYQFASFDKKSKRFYVNQVNYYLYDSHPDRLDESSVSILESNLDKLYKNCDFEKMEKVCNIIKKEANVYSNSIKEEVEALVNKDSYTYFIVSLANDLENVAYANSIIGDLEEGNYKVFARVKEDALYKKNDNKNVVFLGKEDILNHENIVNERLIEFAQRTNMMYTDNSPITKKDILKWQSIILVKQYANIYQALSMFFKIGLMGYDLIKKENRNEEIIVSKEEFEKISPKIEFSKLEYDDYFKNEFYNMIGFIEKARWNAHFLLSSYKPMSSKEFAPGEDGKRKSNQMHGIIKKHGCLTSNYNGLDKLIRTQYLMDKYGKDYDKHDYKSISEDEIKSEEFKSLAKTYYYDFMVFNDIYDIVDKLGYIIIKK